MTKRPLETGESREDVERFARRFWAARKLARLTHEALAQETGVAKAYISYIENLRANPSLQTCARLARGVNRDLGDLTTAQVVAELDAVKGWKPTGL
jgi:transcriptional regulator with XRE-family HTH domain